MRFHWEIDYLLITAAADAPALWSALSAAVASVGGGPVGELAIEAARVAAGSPRFGRELSEEFIPLEAGLKWAVSFNKGCYVGQEVIARMGTYQRLAKRLVILAANDLQSEGSDGGTGVGLWLEVGAEVRVDGLKVGRVTSVSPVVDQGRLKALAYIKTALAEPGRQVEVISDCGTLVMYVLSVPNEG